MFISSRQVILKVSNSCGIFPHHAYEHCLGVCHSEPKSKLELHTREVCSLFPIGATPINRILQAIKSQSWRRPGNEAKINTADGISAIPASGTRMTQSVHVSLHVLNTGSKFESYYIVTLSILPSSYVACPLRSMCPWYKLLILGVIRTNDHVTQFYIKVVLFVTAGSVIVYKIGTVGV